MVYDWCRTCDLIGTVFSVPTALYVHTGIAGVVRPSHHTNMRHSARVQHRALMLCGPDIPPAGHIAPRKERIVRHGVDFALTDFASLHSIVTRAMMTAVLVAIALLGVRRIAVLGLALVLVVGTISSFADTVGVVGFGFVVLHLVG